MRHQQVFTVASSAVLEKFANRVLISNFDQIAFAISHCWYRFNWFEQPHFIHLDVGHRGYWSGLLETPAAGSICHAADMYRRAAGYIAKVLRGTKASDLPIEQPIKFEFAVNLKTAKTLDLVIPPRC